MEIHELEPFLNETECYIELVFNDGTIVVGKEFKRFEFDIYGSENLWEIKPDGKILRLVDGYSVKEIRVT